MSVAISDMHPGWHVQLSCLLFVLFSREYMPLRDGESLRTLILSFTPQVVSLSSPSGHEVREAQGFRTLVPKMFSFCPKIDLRISSFGFSALLLRYCGP